MNKRVFNVVPARPEVITTGKKIMFMYRKRQDSHGRNTMMEDGYYEWKACIFSVLHASLLFVFLCRLCQFRRTRLYRATLLSFVFVARSRFRVKTAMMAAVTERTICFYSACSLL